ncbi:MAG: DUF1080 domain-containing protein [Planctomycetes bacterium]|nr:DUF1080 domain-containing protein [Planctomycetota bacterium]
MKSLVIAFLFAASVVAQDPMPIESRLAAPPSGALILIGSGASTRAWRPVAAADGALPWAQKDGVLEVQPGKGSIVTQRRWQSFRLHLEFRVPDESEGERGNSGVYLQERYEVQILNTFGEPPLDHGAGALYRLRAPAVNAARPAGQWQSYDLVFRAARFQAGKKTEDARITLVHNGVLVHDDVALSRKTGAGQAEGADPRPILLQDHGSPVAFRNTWILPLESETTEASARALASAVRTGR